MCKACFRKTLGETDKFLRVIIEKKIEGPFTVIGPEKRGRHIPVNKIPDGVIDDVKRHIQSFPAYESHYTRRDTSKLYPPGHLSISKMYNLYRQNSTVALSIGKYSQVFKSMNLKFKKPKTDTCSTCDLLKSKVDSTRGTDQEAAKLTQKIHHELADNAFLSKENDKAAAALSNDMKVYTYDLQQCLPTPYLENSISFYKRQLWTFNLTVHDCQSNTPYCYM